MTYMINIDLQPDGTLPVDKWQRVDAASKDEALQAACNMLTLDRLPCTVHVATDKFLWENGTPKITFGYDIEVTP